MGNLFSLNCIQGRTTDDKRESHNRRNRSTSVPSSGGGRVDFSASNDPQLRRVEQEIGIIDSHSQLKCSQYRSTTALRSGDTHQNSHSWKEISFSRARGTGTRLPSSPDITDATPPNEENDCLQKDKYQTAWNPLHLLIASVLLEQERMEEKERVEKNCLTEPAVEQW